MIRYHAGSGAVIGTVISGLNRPTGIGYGPDGSLLVLDAEGVRKYDPQSYAARGMLAATAAGQVAGPTYLSLLPRAGLDQAQIGNQYWIRGNGPVGDRTIQIDPVISTLGPAFGASCDPAQLSIQRWGSLRVQVTSCSRANFRWDSTGADSAGFGSGSYPMQRIIDNEI